MSFVVIPAWLKPSIINQKYPLTSLEIALGTPIMPTLARPNRRTSYVSTFTTGPTYYIPCYIPFHSPLASHAGFMFAIWTFFFHLHVWTISAITTIPFSIPCVRTIHAYSMAAQITIICRLIRAFTLTTGPSLYGCWLSWCWLCWCWLCWCWLCWCRLCWRRLCWRWLCRCWLCRRYFCRCITDAIALIRIRPISVFMIIARFIHLACGQDSLGTKINGEECGRSYILS